MSAEPLSITPDHVQRARAVADALAGDASLSGKRVLAALGLVAMGATRVKAAERAGVPHASALAPSQWRRVGLTDEVVSRFQQALSSSEPEPSPTPSLVAPPAAAPAVIAPSPQRGSREKPKNSTLRRFGSAHIEPDSVVDLRSDHRAVVTGRTIFLRSVVGARESERLLISGHNNPKLGKEVAKGDRAGWPIFQLSLEERATCPRTCPVWAGCYGNAMPFARRHRADADLTAVLADEIAATAAQHPGGFLLRLHTLGDFYSVPYVLFWAEMLAAHPALHVFGYTSRRADDPDPETRKIAQAIGILTRAMWKRFAIRTSHAEFGPQRSVVVMSDPGLPDVIMCPAQTKATEACATCGLCWAQAARDKTIGFLKHGMKRTKSGHRPAALAPQPEYAAKLPPVDAAAHPLTEQQTVLLREMRRLADLDGRLVIRPGRLKEIAGLDRAQWDAAYTALVRKGFVVALERPRGPGASTFMVKMAPSVARIEAPVPAVAPEPPPAPPAPEPEPEPPAPVLTTIARGNLARAEPVRSAARAPRKPSVVTDAGRFVRMKAINPDIVRWSRAYVARGVAVDFLAHLFDVDDQALAREVAL